MTSEPAKILRKGRPPEKFLEFVDGVRSILKKAIEYTENDPPPSLDERKNAHEIFQAELTELLERKWIDPDIVRISKELRKRKDMLLTFMVHEDVPWHNNDAERSKRQGVLHRKISGGRRTWLGADTLGILLSLYETSKKKKENFIHMVGRKLGFERHVEIGNCATS